MPADLVFHCSSCSSKLGLLAEMGCFPIRTYPGGGGEQLRGKKETNNSYILFKVVCRNIVKKKIKISGKRIFLSCLPISFLLTSLYFSISGEKVEKKQKEKKQVII